MLAEWHVGQVLWSIIWLTLFFIWIWLLIGVFADIFRSHDLSGGAKALWVLFVIVLPYLGVFVYLLSRGGGMHERGLQYLERQDRAARAYIQDAAGASPADELTKLAALRDQGVLSDEEFASQKARIVG
jgi:hypothetical protein